MNEMIETEFLKSGPLALDKAEVKYLLAKSGVERRKIGNIRYASTDSAAGEHGTLLASNIANLKKIRDQNSGHHHSGKPGMRRSCRNTYYRWSEMPVIVVDDRVEINGISAKTAVSGGLPKSSTPDASDESKSDTSENEMDVPF